MIVKILGHGAYRKRIIEMGFVKGQHIKVLLDAPLRDPIKYSIMGYEVSLRRSEASLVEVVKTGETSTVEDNTAAEKPLENASESFDGETHTINIALIGNPNCGKTSLFNIASGAREHVGNYSGVTVDAKEGKFEYKGYHFKIVDLPGTYSLSAYSPEELYVRQYLHDEVPDVIVNVVVASNLERNLYLTTELIDMDRSMVIALNMYDELKKSGAVLDYEKLGGMIGVPIVPTVSRTGEGINNLFDTIISVYEGRNKQVRHVHVNLGQEIEDAVRELKDEIKEDPEVGMHFSPRYIAIKLLEHDPEIEKQIGSTSKYEPISMLRDKLVARAEKLRNEDVASAIASEKYGFISGALKETMVEDAKTEARATHVIDSFVTNKLFGFPFFLVVMFLIFWCTFSLGSYPMEWIEAGVEWIAGIIDQLMPDGPLKDLVADGIIGGVGGVIVFLPNIMILYFFISFMEDSGYMARAAFIMDRIMHKIGLHGKSFIPLVMGFGCNVPAIMATRTIESRSSRIITMLIDPFMSCSARLPVYILLIGAFFDKYAALVFMGLYFIGIIVAIITARLLRRFYFHADETPFVMELPPYRLPTLKASLSHMWEKGAQYLKKMGGIILVASIIVWALNYFPIHDSETLPAGSTETAQYDATAAEAAKAKIDDSRIDPQHDSYLEMVGKWISPVMEPLGFHWRASVAALAGLPAKEVVVSTLGVLYTGDEETDDMSLGARLKAPGINGQPDFTPAVALSFMVFVLLCFPCIASITAIIRETGSWKYGVFSMAYNTAVAWIVAFITYHIALLL